ncbi:hypothetical protein [Sphingopyxis sp. GC21]|uniref:hypothetical protein n=1 Tax=Sphingopyxis sp. GC21 TaxID=2933562 RepID=UPI0021E37E7F|nr:hypothetical protein [Sphingopyxis sp. GC21]
MQPGQQGAIIGAMGRGDPSGKWWRRGDRTSYHTYYRPTSNRQGKLLFGLFVLLGLAALGLAGFHRAGMAALSHGDAVLGVIGFFSVLLGLWQIRSLSR